MHKKANWITITESQYPWEREALEYLRDRFPEHEPYRAWANFEFIADDGSINEVDLLVFSPRGFFLIEIKSRPGKLTGDAGTWIWETEGRLHTVDNPLILANLKAKKLSSLLQRQKAAKKKGRLPFLEALVFCSAPDLQFQLEGAARLRVCLRDREENGKVIHAGIMSAIRWHECPGLDMRPRGTHDRPMAKIVARALDQAGIRPLQRTRKVGDYELGELLDEGPGYQDWSAAHVQLKDIKRRIRIYLVRAVATPEERETIQRAALREAQLLETLQHPGVLRTYGLTEHELGPALIFEHDPKAIRLDHYLAQHGNELSVDIRLHLMRQIAEVVCYAHEKKVVHRALSPQSIFVSDLDGQIPRITLYNWQVGYRAASSTSRITRDVSATSHVGLLVEDICTVYMAPEALSSEKHLGEHLDVFSLGALAYHLFSGQAPATTSLELGEKLRDYKGLQISSVLNGAKESLQELIEYSTHPDVINRLDSARDFLALLDDVEEDLTKPDHITTEYPSRAQQGDTLPGNYKVIRRLGQGACSVALLVERDDQEFVLKVASDLEHNSRIQAEAEVLKKLHHQHIVDFCEEMEIGEHACILMHRAGAETLGARLRKEGRLHVDMLQRFGEDLLDVVRYLEEQGIPHRDIKPDNIGVGSVGRGDKIHLVLFDFSLSRTPVDNIRAGTTGYLEPLLPLRKPPRWDLQAERYSVAVTLYELATGSLPQWGDGTTDPSHLDCEVTIEAEAFDANLRDPLTAFFAKALRRIPAERFDNAELMLAAWRDTFRDIEEPRKKDDQDDKEELNKLLAKATFDTQVAELGLGTRATNALDRKNIITVADFLRYPQAKLHRMQGVGNKTRRELSMAVKILRNRLGIPEPVRKKYKADKDTHPPLALDEATLSVDMLIHRLTSGKAQKHDSGRKILKALLGLDDNLDDLWPSQKDLAKYLNVSSSHVGQLLSDFQHRWSKDPAITHLREDIRKILTPASGVMTVEELAHAVLIARGSHQDEPLRLRQGFGITRVAVEVERTLEKPRFQMRRDNKKIFIAIEDTLLNSQDLAAYATRLGKEADRAADEDPLLSPGSTLHQLRAVKTLENGPDISDARLLRMAVAASYHAAISSRLEIYPRGMPAERALRLSHGALVGMRMLTPQQIQERVKSRYPEAETLPSRPALDHVLKQSGLDFEWKAELGKYTSRDPDTISLTSGSRPGTRLTTGTAPDSAEISSDIADAREFEERLSRGIKEGAFLALLVDPKYYLRAKEELIKRFPLEVVDMEGLFIDALQEEVGKAKVNWDLVVKTDAKPGSGDWNKLMTLVRRAVRTLEETLLHAKKTVLMVYTGLLARYEQISLLEKLRDKVGRRDGIPGLWVLVPNVQQAAIDDKAIPVIGPGQRARIPTCWLQNVHRANGLQ